MKITVSQILKFLKSKEGEKITSIEELASYYEIPPMDFVGVIDRRVYDAIERNKVVLKSKMKRTWMFSKNGNLSLSAYKLIATQDELSRLNGNSNEESKSKKDPLLEVLKPKEIWAEGLYSNEDSSSYNTALKEK